MQSCYGAEFIEQKTIHTPFFRDDGLILSVEIFHFSFNESISSFSILKYRILRSSILLLILFEDKLNKFLNKLPKVLVSKNFNNTSSRCHIGLVEN